MYTIDDQDTVVALDGFSLPSGAPEPLLVADERRLVLAYSTRLGIPDDGLRVGQDCWDEADDDFVLVIFARCVAHYLGPPNDEALGGHPLMARGLRWYGAYEIVHSSWIRSLEVMNRVHPRHDPSLHSDRRHYIFTFQDSTFECIAPGFEIRYFRGSYDGILSVLHRLLGPTQPN